MFRIVYKNLDILQLQNEYGKVMLHNSKIRFCKCVHKIYKSKAKSVSVGLGDPKK